jgi:hypothetical protein
MTQGDSVHSTPPTNASALPADPTRRRFITIAAGASIVSVGSLVAAAAAPNAMPEASSAPVDPIFAAIDAFRRADASCVAVHGDIPDELMDLRHAAYSGVLRTAQVHRRDSRRSPHGRASRLIGFARMPAAYMAKTSAPLPSRSMTRPGA